MGLKAKGTNAELNNMFAARIQIIEGAILSRLQFVGETFVVNARSQNTYLDQTGNLRSSIGYIVMKDGRVVSENFKLAGKGTDKNTGLNAGKRYIRELMAKFRKGYVLICVAGMNYAAAVESKNKDVITSSSIQAEEELKKAIRGFKKRL